jgi:hypothetical protein
VSGNAIRKAIPVVLFLCALGYVVFRSLGCKPVEDPGAHQRAIVVSLAHGVRAADKACASVARGKGGREGYELARDCAFAYDSARLSLDAADEALDGTEAPDVPCQVAQALAYANQMAGLIEKHGGKLPKALVHAFALAPMLSERC